MDSREIKLTQNELKKINSYGARKDFRKNLCLVAGRLKYMCIELGYTLISFKEIYDTYKRNERKKKRLNILSYKTFFRAFKVLREIKLFDFVKEENKIIYLKENLCDEKVSTKVSTQVSIGKNSGKADYDKSETGSECALDIDIDYNNNKLLNTKSHKGFCTSKKIDRENIKSYICKKIKEISENLKGFSRGSKGIKYLKERIKSVIDSKANLIYSLKYIDCCLETAIEYAKCMVKKDRKAGRPNYPLRTLEEIRNLADELNNNTYLNSVPDCVIEGTVNSVYAESRKQKIWINGAKEYIKKAIDEEYNKFEMGLYSKSENREEKPVRNSYIDYAYKLEDMA